MLLDFARRSAEENKGFVACLFDLSFDSFVTVKFTKIIYILILVLVGISLIIGWLVPAFTIMATGVALIGVLWLLIGWIIPVIQLVLFRVVLELFIATIRTAQNTAGTRQEIQKLRDEVGQRG
ncbi:DUF4282 domain-containing protein [Auritidibacter ignavus]|nr:DUF4282 domain-containing protein [Auritidibacter sp. NML130574]RMX23376.1 DUF4282 domain-containing protein [Auritidibacter ignavus]